MDENDKRLWKRMCSLHALNRRWHEENMKLASQGSEGPAYIEFVLDEANITQRALAKMMGITDVYLSYLKRSHSAMPVHLVAKLAECYSDLTGAEI